MRFRGGFAFAVMFVLLGSVGIGESTKNVIYSGRSEFTATQTVECLGTISMRSIFNDRITEWADGRGGYHYHWHYNSSQFDAVDAEGNEYSGSETYNYALHVASSMAFPLQETLVLNLRAESRGAGPNLIVKWRMRLTINAPGQVTVSRELLSVECTPQ